MRAHNHGVRGDSVFCLLQYACLKLSKPGLASRPWHRLPPSPCQCQLQLGAVPTASARLGLACGDASSTLFSIFSSGCFSRLSSHLFIIFLSLLLYTLSIFSLLIQIRQPCSYKFLYPVVRGKSCCVCTCALPTLPSSISLQATRTFILITIIFKSTQRSKSQVAWYMSYTL